MTSGSTGDLIAANRYDTWGTSAATNIGRFGYTGQAWLEDIGLYYYRARMYAPELGRFLQTDPVGYEDTVNLYAYVGNDPINFVDPWGTQSFSLRRCRSRNCQRNMVRRASNGQTLQFFDEARANHLANATGAFFLASPLVGSTNTGRQGIFSRIGRLTGLVQDPPLRREVAREALNDAMGEAGIENLPELGRIVGWGSREAGATVRIGQIDRAAVREMRERGLTRNVAQSAREFYRSAGASGRGVVRSSGENVAAERQMLMETILRNW